MFSIKLDKVFTIMFPFICVLIVSSLTRTEGFQLNNSSFIYRDGNIAKNESDMLMKDDSSADFLKREIEKDLAKLESSNSSTIELIDQASNSTGSKLQEILIEKLQENGNLEMSFSLPPITLDDPSEVKTVEMFDTNSDMDITDLLGQNMETQENQESPIMLRVSAIQKLNPQKRFQNEIKKGSQQNVTNLWSLEDLLDIYSPSRLVNVWNKSEELHLTDKCKKDMEDFLDGLENGDLWALQMTDASGRYGGSFLFGNSYWVGSATLCEQIHNMAFKPPFPLGFFMLRTDVMLNKTITAHVRSQLLGVCLPYACTSLDVDQIVALSAQEARLDSQRSLELVTIKSPHNIYNMNEDPVFIILIVSSAIVCILLAIGTGLDYYFEHKVANKSSFTYDNYSFVFSKSSHHRAIITGPTAVKVEANAENNNRNMVEAVPEGSEATTESNSVTSDETVIKTGLLSEIFLSFSVRRNMNTICDRSVGVDTIPTIHGLRSLSMAWVILGHTCIVAFKYSDNMSYRGVVEREFLFQTINNGAFSVDTFFFISGLLVSFLYFRTTAKNDFSELTRTKGMVTSFLHFIGMITYRFGRLSTPYLFVLGVVQISMKWFYYNSVFEPPAADHINCPNYWWRNLLYINTLFPVKDMCMLWSWYLADDTQFYVLGAVLLIMAVKNFRASASLLVLFLVSSWITTMYIAYTNQHMPNVDDPLALFDKIYDKPWTRLGPYLVGMSVGWILFKTDCKIKMNKLFVVLGWTCSTGGLLGLVYGLYESELHPLTAAAYSSLSHTVWALSLAWIVIACSTGYGGFVNSALSATILYPFSRVTYCAYLIHPIVIRIVTMKMDSPIHLGKDIVIILYLGQLVISYILAFVLSLAYEAPVVSLLKIVSPTKRKPKCSQ